MDMVVGMITGYIYICLSLEENIEKNFFWKKLPANLKNLSFYSNLLIWAVCLYL